MPKTYFAVFSVQWWVLKPIDLTSASSWQCLWRRQLLRSGTLVQPPRHDQRQACLCTLRCRYVPIERYISAQLRVCGRRWHDLQAAGYVLVRTWRLHRSVSWPQSCYWSTACGFRRGKMERPWNAIWEISSRRSRVGIESCSRGGRYSQHSTKTRLWGWWVRGYAKWMIYRNFLKFKAKYTP